ncbi:surface antigen-domain-containing protein [Mycena amicta]|nr:surface antigen-domain-containing protein [Mycena amicta]
MADSTDDDVVVPPLRPPLHRSASPRDLELDEKDLDRIRQWQQARIDKKLRGEYESALIHLQDIINSNTDTPSQISSVRVEGGKYHTRPSFLKFLIDPLIPPASKENDLRSTIQAAGRMADVLKLTDMYKSVDARLERAKSPLANPYDVDVVLKARPQPEMVLLSIGTTTRKAANASFTVPLTPPMSFERDCSDFASATEAVRGARALVRHRFAYEAVLRHIGDLKPEASMSIREAAGQTVKSALSHTFVVDTRDDSLVPTTGFYLRTAHELAGLGGDAAFVKSETHAHVSRPLFPGVSLSFAARSGVLWGLNGKPTLFPDRFQLGGPSSVRSFRLNALGPRDDRLPSSLTSLSPRRLTRRRTLLWPVKTHAWINAGRLDDFDKARPLRDTLARPPAVSVGFGLIYNLAPARIELNFGLPVVASKSDGARRGLQFGIGVEFL